MLFTTAKDALRAGVEGLAMGVGIVTLRAFGLAARAVGVLAGFREEGGTARRLAAAP